MRATLKGSGSTKVQTLELVSRFKALLLQAQDCLDDFSPMVETDDNTIFDKYRAELQSMYDEVVSIHRANIEAALQARDDEKKEDK